MKLNYPKIRNEIKRLNLTHEKLAELMDVRRQAVTYWLGLEKNDGGIGISFGTVEKFAKALDLDPKDLII